MATKRDIRRAVVFWRNLLNINEWTIDLVWDGTGPNGDPLADDVYATIFWMQDYHQATLCLCKDWRKWEPRNLNRIICHEMLHLMLRDVNAVPDMVQDLLTGEAKAVLYRIQKHAEEGFVERLAQALVDAVPGWREKSAQQQEAS